MKKKEKKRTNLELVRRDFYSKKDSWKQVRRLSHSGQGSFCTGDNALGQWAAVGERGFAFFSQG